MCEELTKLIENPKVHYIYQIDESIFGKPDTDELFLIVAEDRTGIEKEYPFSTVFYSPKEWFDAVLNGHLIGWICACLNKKYIYKEAVKLLMKYDPVVLRKEAGQMLNANNMFSRVKLLHLRLLSQIILNYKIVNYKLWDTIKNIPDEKIPLQIESTYKSICNITDAAYYAYLNEQKLKRLKKKENNEETNCVPGCTS